MPLVLLLLLLYQREDNMETGNACQQGAFGALQVGALHAGMQDLTLLCVIH